MPKSKIVVGESIHEKDGQYFRTYFYKDDTKETVQIPTALWLRLKKRGVKMNLREKFKLKQKVFHEEYGAGVVIDIYSASGKIGVRFSDKGRYVPEDTLVLKNPRKEYKVSLYDPKGRLKSVETHDTHLAATRSGQNWAMLTKGNTFKVHNSNPRTRFQKFYQIKDHHGRIHSVVGGLKLAKSHAQRFANRFDISMMIEPIKLHKG